MKAVIDRFEGEYAVLLIGEEEHKANIPKRYLPYEACEGTWLKIGFEIDNETTNKQREKISSLLEKLKSRNK